MNAREIELKWMGRVKKVGSLLLLRADDAVRLLDDCVNSQVRFLGVEAFRLFDNGGVQPAMEFSNISFGKIPMQPGDPEFQFKRGLREPWNTDADAIERSKALITAGATSGYDWYEVSLEDPATGNLLFFREPN